MFAMGDDNISTQHCNEQTIKCSENRIRNIRFLSEWYSQILTFLKLHALVWISCLVFSSWPAIRSIRRSMQNCNCCGWLTLYIYSTYVSHSTPNKMREKQNCSLTIYQITMQCGGVAVPWNKYLFVEKNIIIMRMWRLPLSTRWRTCSCFAVVCTQCIHILQPQLYACERLCVCVCEFSHFMHLITTTLAIVRHREVFLNSMQYNFLCILLIAQRALVNGFRCMTCKRVHMIRAPLSTRQRCSRREHKIYIFSSIWLRAMTRSFVVVHISHRCMLFVSYTNVCVCKISDDLEQLMRRKPFTIGIAFSCAYELTNTRSQTHAIVLHATLAYYAHNAHTHTNWPRCHLKMYRITVQSIQPFLLYCVDSVVPLPFRVHTKWERDILSSYIVYRIIDWIGSIHFCVTHARTRRCHSMCICRCLSPHTMILHNSKKKKKHATRATKSMSRTRSLNDGIPFNPMQFRYETVENRTFAFEDVKRCFVAATVVVVFICIFIYIFSSIVAKFNLCSARKTSSVRWSCWLFVCQIYKTIVSSSNELPTRVFQTDFLIRTLRCV